MKITVNIDCTPEEARSAFGLPDLSSLHDLFLREMESRMKQAFDQMSPEAALRIWSGMASQGMEQWQKFFFGAERKD